MELQTIRKILRQKKQVNIFLAYIQCQLYGILISRKKAQFISWEDCMKKICSSIREHVTNVINIEKKKMLPSTKRDKITTKCDDMLHLWKKIHKKVKDKNY